MPFAKRSTYNLTLAISAALFSSYALANPLGHLANEAWLCSLNENEEWNCQVNNTPSAKTEGHTNTDFSNSPSPVESDTASEKVLIKQASPAKPQPIEQPIAVTETGAQEKSTKGAQTSLANSQSKPAQKAAIKTGQTEWQCAAQSDRAWLCQENPVLALLPIQPVAQGTTPAPVYPHDNPFSDLDWVYYQNAVQGQCSGQYLEPEFPLFGDENLPEPPLFIEAAESSTVLGEVSVLKGGINIRQGDQRVSADRAEINQNTHKAKLEDKVKYREPGFLVLSDNAEIDTQTHAAVFNDTAFVLHESAFRGNSEQLIHQEDGRVHLQQGSYTYCPPDSEAWKIDAESTVLDQESGFGTAKHAVLRLANVPVFYTPYFSFPLNDERKSGFLYPSLGYSKEDGLDLAAPYYFNIAPNMDDTLTPRLITKRGLLLQNEFRHINHWSANQVDAAYLANDDIYKDDRWLIALDHQGKIANNWQTRLDYNKVSDNLYFEDLTSDLEVQRQDHLDQSAALTYTGNGWNAELRVHDYQTLDGTAPYQLMPRASIQGGHRFANQISVNYLAELSRFERDLDGLTGANRIIGDRVHLYSSFAYLWQKPWGYIHPRLSLWSNSYNLENQLSGLDNSPSIFAPIASLDSGLFFDRNLANGGTHTLEPRLFALYVPHQDQSDVHNFDTSRHSFNYDYLFRENRFSGRDRLGDAEQLSLGLTTRYIDASGFEKANFKLAQAFYFADREIQQSNSSAAETENNSDIATLATWYLTPNTRTYLDTILDSQDYKVKTSTLGLKYQNGYDRIVDLRYRFADASKEQVDLNYIWPLAKSWTSMGRVIYDIRNDKANEATLGIEYSSCCWTLSLAGQHWIDHVENGEDIYDYGIFLQLSLKGLGAINSGNKGFLNDIIGYEEREAHYED